MGSCFEKKPIEFQPFSTLKKERQPLNIFNRSILLSRNIARDIIPEEDSYIILGSRQSVEEDSICGSVSNGTKTLLAEFYHRNPMGEEVPSCAYVRIRNLISGHWLHSHALKTQKLLNEVCVCEDGQHEHDRWQLLAHHCNTIGDGDVLKVLNRIIKFHHTITHSIMQLSSVANIPLVNCSPSLDKCNDDSSWKLEIINSKLLRVNSVFRIKHLKNEGCLHTGTHRALMDAQWNVHFCFSKDVQDIWYIEEVLK